MRKLLFIPVVLLILAGWWLYRDMQTQLNAPLRLDRPELFAIEPGMSLLAVAGEVERRGWFDYPLYLELEGKSAGWTAW